MEDIMYIVRVTKGIHCTLCDVHCIMYTVNCTIYNVKFNIYTVNCTIYTVNVTLYTVKSNIYTVNCVLYTAHEHQCVKESEGLGKSKLKPQVMYYVSASCSISETHLRGVGPVIAEQNASIIDTDKIIVGLYVHCTQFMYRVCFSL